VIALVDALTSFYTQIPVILFAAFAAAIVAKRFKLPSAVALIVAGALIGPNLLGLVASNEIIGLFADIGAAMLLFYVGLEFDFSKIAKVGVRAAAFAAIKLTAIFIIVYEACLFAGMGLLTAAVAAFMLSFTSTAIMIKILESRGASKRGVVDLLVAELIVEDIIAIAGITLVSSINDTGVSFHSTLVSVALDVAVLGVVYVVLRRLLSAISGKIGKYGQTEPMLFFSLALWSALSVFAGWLGLSPAIGAFMAGSILSSLKAGDAAKRVTEPLGLAFSSFFFISIGLLASPASIFASSYTFGLLLLAQVAACFFAVLFAARTVGLDGKQSSLAACSMLVVGEFSLLLAREAAPLTGFDFVGLAVTAVVVTSIVTALASARYQYFYGKISAILGSKAWPRANLFFSYTSRVFSQLEYGGPMHQLLARELRKLASATLYPAAAATLVIAVNRLAPQATIDIGPARIHGFDIAFVLLVISAAVFSVRALLSWLKVAALLGSTLEIRGSGSVPGGHTSFALNAMPATFFALAYLAFPVTFRLLRLPDAFKIIQPPLLLLAAIFAVLAVTSLRKKTG